MSALEDFILENTGWMVTIAIIISLALIGYIADSNGFMSKDKAKKTSKPKKQVSKENKKDKEDKKTENNVLQETEIQSVKEEENATLVEIPTVEEPIEEEKLEKTRPLNIEKDFQKLMEDDDDVPINVDEEKIDDELWKF